jgi:hypothetical protein
MTRYACDCWTDKEGDSKAKEEVAEFKEHAEFQLQKEDSVRLKGKIPKINIPLCPATAK